MQIQLNGQMQPPVPVAIVPTAPGIFTLTETGKGAGAILNQDNSLNSPASPAALGSIIQIFGTGAGQMNPPSITGQLAGFTPAQPLQPVSVTIGGVPAQIMYAGPAPTLVSGVVQVNAMVPNTAPAGPAIPIVLTVGNASSQPGVTVSIGP
jgi:uncharacterized protein (TIGR03437 family)